MGSQVGTSALGLLGNVLGGFIGGPIGSMVGGMAGGIIGSLLFSRKAKPLVPDVQLMNSSYGKPIPIVWGTMRLPSNMIWQTDITTHEHSSGKMSGPTTYTYTQSAAHAFCEGPVQWKKLFLDGKLFIDNTSLFPQELTKYQFAIRPYAGDDVQVADPSMVYWVATHVIPFDSCPAYRGLAYLVFDQPELNHFGNRFPQVTAIVSTTVTNYTVFKEFKRFTQTGAGTLWGRYVDTVPDWYRGVLYVLYRPQDYTTFTARNWGIMVFNLYNQQEIAVGDYNHIFFDGALIPDSDLAFPGHDLAVGRITCAPGSMIYVAVSDYVVDYVITIDPNSLIYTGDLTRMTPPNNMPYFGIDGFRGFALNSVAGGTTFLIAGIWGSAGVFVCNPLEGTISNPFIVEYQNLAPSPGHPYGQWLNSNVEFQLGEADNIAGRQQIWVLNVSSDDPKQRVFLYQDYIVGSDPSMQAEWGSIELVRAFTAFEFGADTYDFPGDIPTFVPPGTYWNTSLWSMYNPSDDGIVINLGGQWTLKFSILTNIAWTTHGYGYGWVNRYAQTEMGFLPVTGGGLLQMILDGDNLFLDTDLATGVNTHSPVRPGDYVDNASPGAAIHSSSYGNLIIWQGFWTNELWISYLLRQQDNKARVADIIHDICIRVGMTEEMLDLSLVTQTTDGYCIQEMKSAGSAIADLLHVYQIDMVESDYTLKFIPRGQADAAVIPEGDLASLDANDPSQYWKVKEAQQQEMPMILVVRFQDPDLDFQSGASYAKRTEVPVSTIWSKRRMTIDLPVIVNNQGASEIASKWLYTMWAERDTVETVLPWKYLYLDPADNIQVLMDNGDFFEVRIEEQNIGADLSIRINAAFEDNTVYNPSPTQRGASYGFIPQTVQQAPFAEFLQFNVPLLQDQDDTGGVSTRIYYAVGPTAAGWITGEVFRSTDNSATWQDYINIPIAANWGQSLNTLGDTPSKFATDYANTVTIALQGGSQLPQSCTFDEMCSGSNGALLGQEVIQYQIVTLNPDLTVTLSNLLRGRRGTEWATGLHGTGERFIMLQAGKISGNTLSLAEIGVQELWKLVPSGRFIDQSVTNAFTYRGFDLMPYAPVQIKRGTVAGPGMPITWVRRTRLGNILMDGTDTAPLYESSELYNAYILPGPGAIATFNPANPASYTRSYLSLATPTCTYTSGQMTTDSFYPTTSTLYVAVYQLSGVVGMGFQGYAVLPPF